MRIAPDGEIQFRGRTVFGGYWNAPEATAAAFTEDGWYRTGDIGHLDDAGRLILSGRTKDIIVLPNGFNVYPEDIENALRVAGIRDSVVVETAARADRGDRPWRGQRDAAGRAARDDRCRGQGRQREPRPEPAHRRLAALARGGLPADAHAQGQARPGPCLGRRRHGRCRSPRRLARRGSPTPSVSSARWIPGALGVLGGLGQPVVDDHRRADDADDVDACRAASGPCRARSRGSAAARRRPPRPGPGRGTRRRRCSPCPDRPAGSPGRRPVARSPAAGPRPAGTGVATSRSVSRSAPSAVTSAARVCPTARRDRPRGPERRRRVGRDRRRRSCRSRRRATRQPRGRATARAAPGAPAVASSRAATRSGRPPIRWKCRWSTVWPPHSPTLVTIR